jgi:hypothetical protein
MTTPVDQVTEFFTNRRYGKTPTELMRLPDTTFPVETQKRENLILIEIKLPSIGIEFISTLKLSFRIPQLGHRVELLLGHVQTLTELARNTPKHLIAGLQHGDLRHQMQHHYRQIFHRPTPLEPVHAAKQSDGLTPILTEFKATLTAFGEHVNAFGEHVAKLKALEPAEAPA